MTLPNTTIESITSDPVLIDSSETEDGTNTPTYKGPSLTVEDSEDAKKEEDLVQSVYDLSVGPDSRFFRERERVVRNPERIITHSRNYSPPPRARGFVNHMHQIPSLIDTASLNDFINDTDVVADKANGNMILIANHPFHSSDLEKISWILKIGIQDTWVQKPVSHLSSNGFQFDLPPGGNSRRRGGWVDSYDDRYYDDFDGPMDRQNVPIARLGTALRIFKDDSDNYGTKKVKFVIAVQGKRNAGWLRLVVSHSRQAAAVDIFHDILNGHSIQFVGAVLQDVVIPVEAPNRQPRVKFQRVGSLKEAEEVEKGVVGVIC